jgi:hypothetical protein
MSAAHDAPQWTGCLTDHDSLAVRALDRILADESERRSLWEESEQHGVRGELDAYP